MQNLKAPPRYRISRVSKITGQVDLNRATDPRVLVALSITHLSADCDVQYGKLKRVIAASLCLFVVQCLSQVSGLRWLHINS